MPLHAAGNYRLEGPGHKVSDFAISSYTPTLSALISRSTLSEGVLCGMLAVSEPSSLPGTVREIEAVRKHFQGLNFDWLNGAEGTKEAVLAGMVNHQWIHLACHAVQDSANPLKSSFKLAEGDLELSEIMRGSFPQGRLAFLSACQTATGDEALPEESVHLAAGMLFAGFPTVIATMWSIQDEDAPLVASEVYAQLLNKDTGKPDAKHAALALHKATGKLREAVGEAKLDRWVPFIHIGL